MRVSEWTGDIYVSISAMQLSLPKMSGGGGGDDGLEDGLCRRERESAMERERVPRTPPLSVP